MNKAEEIMYANCTFIDTVTDNFTHSTVKSAMKDCAIGFAEWINEHKWIGRYDNMWYKSFSANDPITTEQLYQKFNSETTT